MWWKQKEDIVIDELTTLTPPEEKWIWVEGYKGVDQDMRGYNKFQYELGKEYSVKGDIVPCQNGLHFSLNLNDTFQHKDALKDRFFKVKAYVKEKDFMAYGNCDPHSFAWPLKKIDKLVAQKIILTEEITETEEFFSAIKQKYSEFETYEDYKNAQLYGYGKFVRNKYKSMLSDHFSELFLEIFCNKFAIDELTFKTKEALAYIEEGVSKDVIVYLLMK